MLLEHKLGRLSPCMDSLTPKTFETIRRGTRFKEEKMLPFASGGGFLIKGKKIA